MKTYHPADKILVNGLSKDQQLGFANWLTQLENIISDYANKHQNGNGPYSIPLAKSTGLSCWFDSFIDDLSPAEAFDEDRSCWD